MKSKIGKKQAITHGKLIVIDEAVEGRYRLILPGAYPGKKVEFCECVHTEGLTPVQCGIGLIRGRVPEPFLRIECRPQPGEDGAVPAGYQTAICVLYTHKIRNTIGKPNISPEYSCHIRAQKVFITRKVGNGVLSLFFPLIMHLSEAVYK